MTIKDRSAAIVVAGGSGTRFGSMKQFAYFFGFPVISWCIRELVQVVSHIVVVLPQQILEELVVSTVLKTICSLTNCPELPKPVEAYFKNSANSFENPESMITLVPGGATRSESVRNGLFALFEDYSAVVVHDAARPLAKTDLFLKVIAKIAEGYDGATCYLPVTDTIKFVEDNASLTTLNRQRLIAVQTPQAFSMDALKAAHSRGEEATDDIALLEGVGAKIALIEGDPLNLKITDPDDIILLEALLAAKTAHSQNAHVSKA